MTTSHGTYEALQAENELLRQRIADLEQSDQSVRATFGGITDIILVLDKDGRYVDILPTNPQLLYKPSHELIGKSLHDVMPTELADQFLIAIRQVLQTGEIATVEYVLPFQTGEVWFNTTVNPVSDTTIVLVARDITERKQMEADLQAMQERLHHLITSNPTIIYSRRTSDDYEMTFVSANVSSIFGYTAQEFVANSQFWVRHIHPDDAPRITTELSHLFESGEHTHEYRFLHKDGTYRWLHDQLKLIRDGDGNPIEMVGSWQDITDRKRAEENLRTFEVLVETAPEGISVANLDGVITYANPAFRAMTGYGEALIGMSFFALYPEEELPSVTEAAQQVVARGTWQGQLVLLQPTSARLPIQLTSFVIRDANGQPTALTGMFQDLTKQQQAERERAALQQEVIAAQQAAIRELSTPLIPIADDVVIMPIIGTVDSARARQVLETLLEGVAAHQASIAILDITGVQVVDTQVANALIHAAQAVKLLGTQVVLTGIRPEVAQTLVHLGVELKGIVTHGTLQTGIAFALTQSA